MLMLMLNPNIARHLRKHTVATITILESVSFLVSLFLFVCIAFTLRIRGRSRFPKLLKLRSRTY